MEPGETGSVYNGSVRRGTIEFQDIVDSMEKVILLHIFGVLPHSFLLNVDLIFAVIQGVPENMRHANFFTSYMRP